MTIRSKVIGSSIAILVLFSFVSLYNYSRSKNVNERLMWINDLFIPLSRQVVLLQGQIQNLSEEMKRGLFQKEENVDSSTFSRVARDLYPYVIQKRFAAIEGILEKQKEIDPKFVIDLNQLLNKAKEHFNRLTTEKNLVDFESQYADLRSVLISVSKRVDEESQSLIQDVQSEGRETILLGLSLSVLVIIFGVGSIWISSKLLQPLPTLIQGVKKIREGDFDQSVKMKVSEKDEIEFLAREFNLMAEALRERDQQIQKQQREIVQSERLAAVGQLSAEVVHEIRNPLNAISLNIDWLESELEAQPEEVRKTLRSIAREIQRLNQITESYLVRSRVPKQGENLTPVNELLREVIEFEKEAYGNTIDIKTELSLEEIYVKSDRSRLKQAFINVLKNAREAMPRGGKIEIKTNIDQNTSRIEVKDSGHGMSEKTKKNTFLPFFTTKTNGTGIGLTLTKEIVEEANGSIDCLSEIGKGTTFVFQFPV